MRTSLVKGFVSLLGGGRDGSASAASPLDPSTELRVSGPSAPGMESGSAGVGLQEGWVHALAHLRPASAGMIRLRRTGSSRGVGKTS